MSLLMGALGGLGQGMIKVGTNMNERLAEDVKNQRAENMLRLGITLKEESAGRERKAEQKFKEDNWDTNQALEQQNLEMKSEVAVKQATDVTTATEKAKLDFKNKYWEPIQAQLTRDHEFTQALKDKDIATMEKRLSSMKLPGDVKGIVIAKEAFGVDLSSWYAGQAANASREKIVGMEIAGKVAVAKAEKPMSQKDAVEIYLKTYEAKLAEVKAENEERGGITNYFNKDKQKLSAKGVIDRATELTTQAIIDAEKLVPEAKVASRYSAAINSGLTKAQSDLTSGSKTKEQVIAQIKDEKNGYGFPPELQEQVLTKLGLVTPAPAATTTAPPMPTGGAKVTTTPADEVLRERDAALEKDTERQDRINKNRATNAAIAALPGTISNYVKNVGTVDRQLALLKSNLIKNKISKEEYNLQYNQLINQ